MVNDTNTFVCLAPPHTPPRPRKKKISVEENTGLKNRMKHSDEKICQWFPLHISLNQSSVLPKIDCYMLFEGYC